MAVCTYARVRVRALRAYTRSKNRAKCERQAFRRKVWFLAHFREKRKKKMEKNSVGKFYNRQSYPQVIHMIKSEARKGASRLSGKACIYKRNQVEKVRRILGREAVAMAYAA